MRERSGSADLSPTPFPLVTFKPRQVLLLEQRRQRNSSVLIPMGKNQAESPAKLKAEQETIIACSIALWLENKGFSKVLNRLLAAAQIQNENWKADALNLNEVFSKYQEVGGDVKEKLNAQKKQEEQVVAASNNGDVQSVMTDEKSKKKKKNKEAATYNVHTSGVMAVVNEKVKKCDEIGNENAIKRTSVDSIVIEQKPVPMKESKDANIHEVPIKQSAKAQKVKKTKKSNQRLDTPGIDKEQIDVTADSELTIESKYRKKGKKLGDDLLNADKVSEPVVDKAKIKKKSKQEVISSGELPSSGAEMNGKSMAKLTEHEEDTANESKKVTKKRKRMAGEDSQNQATQEPAVEESKPKKAKGLEEEKDVQPHITLDGSDESSKDHPNKGVDKSGHSMSGRKEPNSSSKLPKTVNAFQRVKVDEVEIDDRLQDNSYWAKGGADIGYGAKAQEILGQVKGKDFRHEKTKKKRGSYRGGQIDLQSHSIKFVNSDDE